MLESIDNENQPQPQMPLKDKIVLSPIDKYRIYGRFPWKMISQILLIVGTTVQAMLVNSVTTDYCRGQERVYYSNFISSGGKENPDYPRQKYLYSLDQVKEHLKMSITNFNELEKTSLEVINYVNKDDKSSNIKMEVSYIDKAKQASIIIPNNIFFDVTVDQLGPFDYELEEIKKYIENVQFFKLNFTFQTFVPFYYEEHFECFGWTIYQKYDYTQQAHFVVGLDIDRIACEDNTSLNWYQVALVRYLWVHIIVLLLSSLSLGLGWKSLYKLVKLYWVKKNSKKLNFPEEKLPTSSYNKWNLISIIGNILQFFASIVSLFDKENVYTTTDILVGFGCMFAYFNIGKYLDYDIEYSTIYATLQRALPNVIRFLIGVMPIFIGFIFFGLCVFWRSERFFNTSGTMITLFSMINGDSIYDIISDLTGISFFLGQIYSYSFCILFIVVVMNVFISIIEEAYVSSKMRNQNHWIYNYLKIDPQFAQISGLDKDDHTKLPNIENMNKMEIKEELNKRTKRLEESLERCERLSGEIEKIKNKDTRERVKSYLNTQIKEIEKKIEKLRKIWDVKQSEIALFND